MPPPIPLPQETLPAWLPAEPQPIPIMVVPLPKCSWQPQKKETDAYKIKDTEKLLSIAPYLEVATTVEVDGETLDRDIDEIAVEVGEKALNEWGKAGGELLYLKRAPEPLYEKWKKNGVRSSKY